MITEVGTKLRPLASYWPANMTENHLGRNIHEAPWAPVTYHIPDDEDQVGP
jgi:hypothetical protein